MSRLPASVRKVVCYIRRSREDEEAELRGEDTLAKQREMLVSDVLSRYPVEYDIAEEVASGDSIAERPVFRSLLPRLGATYQAIVCKDLSRLGRGSYKDMGTVYDTVRQRRVFIITRDAVYDPHNFSDLRMIRFSLFFHREEYEMTLWRLTEGKYDGAARGNWVAGSVPFGYRYHAAAQTLRPDEEEAEVVRLIFTWYGREALGYRAIAERLTQLGYPTPRGGRQWHPEVVRRMLRNPAYCGTLVFRRTQRDPVSGKVVRRPPSEQIVVEHAFDPLVPQELWDACQGVRRANGSAPSGTRRRNATELTGLVRCAACERTLVRQSSRQQYRRKDGQCSVYDKEFLYCPTCRYAVKYRDCEAQLLSVLARIPFDARRFANTLASVRNQLLHPCADGLSPERIVARKAQLEARLRRARNLLLDGTFTPEEYLTVKAECEEQLSQLDARSSAASERETSGQIVAEDVESMRTFGDFYQSLTSAASRRELLQAVIQSATLQMVQKGGGRNRPSRFDLTVRLQSGILLNSDEASR
jgi:DNA invertase Pin-like site-specific DNA recombinase